MKTGWEKNVCSYILWLLYTISAGTVLILAMVRYGVRMGKSGVAGAILGILLLLAEGVATAAVCLWFRRHGRIPDRNRGWLAAELILVAILMVAGISLRWRGIGTAGQKANYFHMAYVAEGESIPRVAHGIVAFYLRLLHACFYVLGNKLSVGIALQIALQMLAILCLYLAVRRLTGAIAALVAMGVLVFSPTMIYEADMLSPEMCFLFVFGAVALAVTYATCVRRDVIRMAAAGAAVGFAGQLDALGLSLLVLLLGMLFWNRSGETTESRERLRLTGAGLCGCLVTFMIFMGAESLYLRRSIKECLRAWTSLHTTGSAVFPAAMFDGTVRAEVIVLAGLLCIGVFTFWYRREEYIGPWLLLMLVTAVAGCVGMTSEEIPSTVCLLVLAAMVAGNGIEGLFAAPEKVRDKRGAAQGARSEAEGEVLYQAREPEREEAKVQDMEGYENNTNTQDGVGQEPAAKPQLLENPLPVPKRQKKPALDYDIVNIKGKEFYDVSVKNDDDFDIQ